MDAKTENEIVSALREAMAGRTTFVVSSRLSLLRRADVILVLEDGRLDANRHARELAHRPGPYHETALLQLMDLGDTEGGRHERSAPPSAKPATAPSPPLADIPRSHHLFSTRWTNARPIRRRCAGR